MSRERGAVALLMAALILGAAAAAALAVHRTVLRAWATEGDALQGERAALAADSVLAWCLDQGAGFLASAPVHAAPAEALPGVPGLPLGGQVEVTPLGERGGLRCWKLSVEGRAGDFRQVREAYVSAPSSPPAGDEAPLTLGAWRILRE